MNTISAIQGRLFINALVNDAAYLNRMLKEPAVIEIAIRKINNPDWVCTRFIEIHEKNEAGGTCLLLLLSLAEESLMHDAQLMDRIGRCFQIRAIPARAVQYIEHILGAREIDQKLDAWWRAVIAAWGSPT